MPEEIAIDDAIIEGVTTLANSKKIAEHIEPNVAFHRSVGITEVKRVLYSACLITKMCRDRSPARRGKS